MFSKNCIPDTVLSFSFHNPILPCLHSCLHTPPSSMEPRKDSIPTEFSIQSSLITTNSPKQSFLNDFFKPIQVGKNSSDLISPVDVSSYFQYDFLPGFGAKSLSDPQELWIEIDKKRNQPNPTDQIFVSLAIEIWYFFLVFSQILNVSPCTMKDFLYAMVLSNPSDGISPILPTIHISLLRLIRKKFVSTDDKTRLDIVLSNMDNSAFSIPEERLVVFNEYSLKFAKSSINTDQIQTDQAVNIPSEPDEMDSSFPHPSSIQKKQKSFAKKQEHESKKPWFHNFDNIKESNWTMILLDCISDLCSNEPKILSFYPKNIEIENYNEFYFSMPLEMRIVILKILIDIVLLTIPEFHDSVDQSINLLLTEPLERTTLMQELAQIQEKHAAIKLEYESVLKELESTKSNSSTPLQIHHVVATAVNTSDTNSESRRSSQRKAEQREAEKIRMQHEHKSLLRGLYKKIQNLSNELKSIARSEIVLSKKLESFDDQYEMAKRVRPSPIAYDKAYNCDYWWLDNKRGVMNDPKVDTSLLPYCGKLLIHIPDISGWAYINHPEEAKIALFSASSGSQKYTSSICHTLEQHPDRQSLLEHIYSSKKPQVTLKRKPRARNTIQEKIMDIDESNTQSNDISDSIPTWMRYVNLFKAKPNRELDGL